MAEHGTDNCISATAVDRLLAAHDGDVALLWLWLSRHAQPDLESAARDLCRTRAEMEAAWEKLRRMELAQSAAAPAVPPTVSPAPIEPSRQAPADPPEYTARDIVERGDPAFTALVAEAQRVLGHGLSTPDLKKLFGIYDYLALPAEVVMQLLHYCAASSRGRVATVDTLGASLGEGLVVLQAALWRDEGMTLEQAEAFIAEQARRREESAAVAELLGIRGRELTGTERKYIQSWLEADTPRELISLAYDRTVTNTGALKWSYMNKILQSWREKGLRSVAQVQEKDLPPRRGAAPAAKPDKPVDLTDLRSMLKKR